MGQLLERINSPADVKKLSAAELKKLAQEIREFITAAVSRTGGHLASNLGVVELTVALHYVFDFEKDKLLWDVGHQCYTHKILTGRKEQFDKLRRRGGVSGFPNPTESQYDVFTVGHAGTSIATALGMALGAERLKVKDKIVAVVGDASIVNGLSFEALNNLGLVKRQLLVVLNDNSMAIDVTQGALAKFLARVRLSQTYEDMRKTANTILEHLPLVGKTVEEAIEKLKKSIRMTISPSQLFESLNIPYFGPVNGHDIGSLIALFKALAKLNHPALLHIYTNKGEGFRPADADPCRFHSTGPFDLNGDVVEINHTGRSFTNAFGDILVELAAKDERIVAINAAMPDGTGLVKFREKFPDRYYDVGIAESAAVDIAAGLANAGVRPIVCIYSTFLQRGYDQIFQEVALQNLPVIFCLDRAGFVGSDGPTHHGLTDIGFLRMLPNMVLIGPSDETELKAALQFALSTARPVAVRYPKDLVPTEAMGSPVRTKSFELGKSVPANDQSDSEVVLVAYGVVLKEAIKAAQELAGQGIKVDVINARFAKPIDERIINLIMQGRTIITIEDHYLACGFGSAVLEAVGKTTFETRTEQAAPVTTGRVLVLGGPDNFIDADSRNGQLAQAGLSAEQIARIVRKLLGRSGNTLNSPGKIPHIRDVENAEQLKKTTTTDNLRRC
jgi:1-deoxy-D-xylulose-5-phosphate synthase